MAFRTVRRRFDDRCCAPRPAGGSTLDFGGRIGARRTGRSHALQRHVRQALVACLGEPSARPSHRPTVDSLRPCLNRRVDRHEIGIHGRRQRESESILVRP